MMDFLRSFVVTLAAITTALFAWMVLEWLLVAPDPVLTAVVSLAAFAGSFWGYWYVVDPLR